MTARKYSNTFAETTLTGSISNSATTIQIGSTTGLPASFPYTLALDYGSATVEMVTVTALAGSNLTVTRGQDGTSAQSHSAGARVVHPVSARDLSEPQVHMEATSDVHGLTGGATVVGTSQSQTLTNKTISGSNNTLTNIGNSSLIDIAAAKVTQPFAAMTVTGAAGASQAMTVTGDEVTRTKPIASWKRGSIGLFVDEDAVVDINSDLTVGTVRASGAAALTSRLYVLATTKIGLIIQRVVGQTQDLFQILTEGGAGLFTVSNTGGVNAGAFQASGAVIAGTSLSGATLATSGAATVGTTLGVTGLVTASAGVSVTGGVTASGAVQGATVTATGAVNGATAAITGAATTGAAGVAVFGEGWTGLSLASGWTGTLKYRKVAAPAGGVWLIGTMAAGTKADGTTVTTLPVGARPPSAQDVFASADAVSGGQSVHFNIAATGVVTCWGIGAGASAVGVNGILSLDA